MIKCHPSTNLELVLNATNRKPEPSIVGPHASVVILKAKGLRIATAAGTAPIIDILASRANRSVVAEAEARHC